MKYLIILFLINYVSAQGSVIPVCDPNTVTWHHHPLYCDRYFLCFWGTVNERFCAPGLHYNRYTTQCMWPEMARCEIDTGIYCPAVDDPDKLIFISDFNDCQSYFLCFNGFPISRRCADNFYWDMNDNWCTVPDSVTCDPRAPNDPRNSTAVTTTTRNPNIFDCPISTQPSLHPHTLDCWRYFLCLNGVSFLRSCEQGILFDTVSSGCAPANQAVCYPGSSTDRRD